MTTRRVAGFALVAVLGAGAAWAQTQHHHGSPAATPAAETRQPVRITMEELHRGGGAPPGWRFSWPDGDARKGREAFEKFECYQCHEVTGESFPAVTPDPTRRGPALAGMGDQHPAEYFAESLINPNAVIVLGPGHTGPDGLSIMPDFRDSLTLAEAIDVVAYIRSLRGGGEHDHGPGQATAARERVAGDYRVRIAYHAPGGSGGHQHGASQGRQHGSAPAGAPRAHLMVFVSDVQTGAAVPYLPVTATVHADKAPPRTASLVPMVGGQGFHYGADVTLPAATSRITVTIGRPSVRVMPSAGGRYARAEVVSFDWKQ